MRTSLLHRGLGSILSTTLITVGLAHFCWSARAQVSNYPPSISLNTNVFAGSVGVLSPVFVASVSDPDTATTNLHVTVSSSNPDVITGGAVTFASDDSRATRVFSFVPRGVGIAKLVLRVDDGRRTNSAELTVTAFAPWHPVFVCSTPLRLTGPMSTGLTLPVSGVQGEIGKLSVSLLNVQPGNPASMEFGLFSYQAGESFGDSAFLGRLDGTNHPSYAQLTFADGAPTQLPSGSGLTNVVIAPVTPFSSWLGKTPNRTWMLGVTNRSEGTEARIDGGWMLTLFTRPYFNYPIQEFGTEAGRSMTMYFNVGDYDGVVTNISVSLPDNPQFAQVKARMETTDLALATAYYTGQVGTNRLQLVLTDDDGLTVTNFVLISFWPSTNPPPSIGFGGSGYFGSCRVGSFVDRTFYVTNTGGGVLLGKAATQPPFTVISGGSYSLGAGASEEIRVRYSPTSAGTNVSSLSLSGGNGMTVPIWGEAFLENPLVTFGVDSTNAVSGGFALVPVRVWGFNNLATFQFSVHWDPNLASFQGAEPGSLPGLNTNNFGVNGVDRGTLTVSWDDSAGLCRSLQDGSTLFTLHFLVTAPPGSTNVLFIDNNPTAIEAAACDLSIVPTQIQEGRLYTYPSFPISGKIVTPYPARPVPTVLLSFEGPTNTYHISGMDGFYSTSLTPGSYCVSLLKDDGVPAEGVTSLDILLIRQHLLGLRTLDAPYALLAADVNDSRSISTLDIAHLRRFVLGTTNALKVPVLSQPTTFSQMPRSRGTVWVRNAIRTWRPQPASRIILGSNQVM